MANANIKSEELYARAVKVLPGGVSRNAVFRRPHPAYAERGEGCRVWDIEGNSYLDFANNMASLIHGHANPTVVAAVVAQLSRGTAFTLATEQEVVYAEYLCSRQPAFEQIRFVNSGTEAVMGCLKAARAFTGRPMIAKVEGAYHGLYDYAEVSQTAGPDNWGEVDSPRSVPVSHGTPESALNDVVIIPFNDSARATAILDRHAERLACVLIDPMPHRVGLIPADAGFIATLRNWCNANGALLIFDEVITFRSSFGGAQDWYEESPDLTAMGKVIGGGFPVGAFAGRREVMSVLDPRASKVLFPHSGTFSANPLTMTAGLAAMQAFDQAEVVRLNSLADRARLQISEAAAIAGVPLCVTGGGSMFRLHLRQDPPRDYRSGFASAAGAAQLTALLDHLFTHGIMLINSGTATLSTPMTEVEVDRLSEELLAGLRGLPAVKPQA